jgi:hypothetical protein
MAPAGSTSGPARQSLRTVSLRVFAALPASTRRRFLHARGRYAPWEEGFDFTPPVLHEGEVTGPPDFVGIGAQKAGTTWWYDLIAAHPQVACRPDIHKERHFFDRFATSPFGPADRSRYHGWFPRPSGFVTGEWTPDYVHLPWVPALLAEAAPQTRLLVLLRDPVERLRSGLSHHRRHEGRLDAQACADAVARGFYEQALARWMAYFPSEQFLLLQYERCLADPVGQLARTYDFLGLAPFVPDGIERRVSSTRNSVDLDPDTRRRLADLYAPDVVALATHHPDLELDLGRWPNFPSLVTR